MSRKEKRGNRPKKRKGGIVVILIVIITIIWISSGDSDDDETVESNGEDAPVVAIEDDYDEPEDEILTFGSVLMHDDFEIEIGSADDIIWRILENQFSDYYGYDVFGVPVRVTNLSGETGRLAAFSYDFFAPDGTRLHEIDMHFDSYDIWHQGTMRHEASQEGYFIFLYKGDGDYFIEFTDLFRTDVLEAVLPITK